MFLGLDVLLHALRSLIASIVTGKNQLLRQLLSRVKASTASVPDWLTLELYHLISIMLQACLEASVHTTLKCNCHNGLLLPRCTLPSIWLTIYRMAYYSYEILLSQNVNSNLIAASS